MARKMNSSLQVPIDGVGPWVTLIRAVVRPHLVIERVHDAHLHCSTATAVPGARRRTSVPGKTVRARPLSMVFPASPFGLDHFSAALVEFLFYVLTSYLIRSPRR